MISKRIRAVLAVWLMICAQGGGAVKGADGDPTATLRAASGSILTTAPAAVSDHEVGISLWWSAPFVLLLGAIALMPFIRRHWWERNYPYVSFGLALLVGGYYFFGRRTPSPWLHAMGEYVSFIVLLGALFVISGGISIRVNRKATPAANAGLLLIGAVIANVFGTTGAAMLLIRPFLRMNRDHIRPYHVVFFIFVVANCGGALTPIGDPPLFLGYLKGVPFWWVAEHMLAPWLLVVGLLVGIFFVIDTIDYRRKARAFDQEAGPQAHVLGIHNFLFIAVVIVAVFRPSVFEVLGAMRSKGLAHAVGLPVSREVLMLAAAVVSRAMTGKTIYESNDFNYGPIREVAILFVGIFSTMVPALGWLEQNAEQKIKIHTPGQFYFATGSLSAVLDNAPTYLTFLQMLLGELNDAQVDEAARVLAGMKDRTNLTYDAKAVASEEVRSAVDAMIKYHDDDVRNGTVRRDELEIAFLLGNPEWNRFIVAISAGAVFFGACTYIGNGPNFMVKSIADAGGIKTPGFVEYVWKYTLPVLMPVYVLVWGVFFWRG